ncbi:unnamed protein product [Caenorhabditis nigoni]
MGLKSSKISKKSKNDSQVNKDAYPETPDGSENDSFDRMLYEQNLRNAEELEIVRAERKKKQERLEAEIRKMKEESRKRIEILLKCIMARHRFEEQEQNWKDWILGCRQNIVLLLRRWMDFAEEHEDWRRIEKIDHHEFLRESSYLSGSVMITYNAMQYDFEYLEEIRKKFPGASFVQVLKKCIADCGELLLDIYSSIQNLKLVKSDLELLCKQFGKLKPDLIYSTSQLRRICREPDFEKDYKNIKFPTIPQTTTFEF